MSAVHKIAFMEALRDLVPEDELSAAFDRFMQCLSGCACGQRVYIGKRGKALTEYEREMAVQLLNRGYTFRQVATQLHITRYRVEQLSETRTDFRQEAA